MRAARLYGIGIAVSYAIVLWMLPAPLDAGTVANVLRNALSSASWAVAGFSALSLARDLTEREQSDGIAALIRLHGYDTRELQVSIVAAGALAIWIWVLLPFAALVAVSAPMLDGVSKVSWTMAWLSFAVLYSAALALGASMLSRGCAELYPRHGRLVLVALVLMPHVLRLSLPGFPSLPASFAWLIEQGAALVVRLS
jgi:hypothetical protein